MSHVLVRSTRGGLLLRVVVVSALLALAFVVVAIVGRRVPERTPGPGWVRGAALSVVRERGVVDVPAAHAYLVSTGGGAGTVALLARSPQLGEPVRYCVSSGWFEDPMHGSKFDRIGRYALGPAPHGLDRLAVRVLDGIVWIDPSAVAPGQPRGLPTIRPTGPFCVRQG
jgi:hypothetical protein